MTLEQVAKIDELKATWGPLLVPRETWTEVDEALFTPSNLFTVERGEAERLRFRAIKHSLQYHFEMNPFYHELCKDRGFQPEDVKTIKDLVKVPLIPESIFKGCTNPSEFVQWLQGMAPKDLKYPPVSDQSNFDSIIAELDKHGFNVTFSSGTSGRFTFVPHDELTWKRARYAIGICGFHLVPLFFDIMSSPRDCNLLLVMPDPKLTHLFMARAVGGFLDFFPNSNVYPAITRTISTRVISLSQGQTHGVRDKITARIAKGMAARGAEKSDERLIGIMKGLEKEGKGGVLGGPPFWTARILSKIEESVGSLNLGDRWVIIAGGGWKTAQSTRMGENEFRERVSQILGVPQSNVRDLYSMSECNAPFPACEGNYKHVPNSVVQPFILDENLEPVGYGVTGRFAFLDPLARSYPGFVIMSDRAKLLEDCPGCGRPGPVLEPEITRIPGVDDRGCAGVMRKIVESEVGSSS